MTLDKERLSSFPGSWSMIGVFCCFASFYTTKKYLKRSKVLYLFVILDTWSHRASSPVASKSLVLQLNLGHSGHDIIEFRKLCLFGSPVQEAVQLPLMAPLSILSYLANHHGVHFSIGCVPPALSLIGLSLLAYARAFIVTCMSIRYWPVRCTFSIWYSSFFNLELGSYIVCCSSPLNEFSHFAFSRL